MYIPLPATCSKLNCRDKKQCLIDQNMIPHCVNCAERKCVHGSGSKMGNKSVCGTDGITYSSICHLRQAACHKGKAIPIAYKGPCKSMLLLLFFFMAFV